MQRSFPLQSIVNDIKKGEDNLASIKVRSERIELLRKIKTTSIFMYVVAGSTILNSIMIYTQFMGGINLIPVGMYLNQLFDYMAVGQQTTSPILESISYTPPIWLAAVASVVVSALMAMLAFFIRKKKRWAVVAAAIIKSFDVIGLSSGLSSIWTIVFDVFTVIILFGGLRSQRTLVALDDMLAEEGESLPDDDVITDEELEAYTAEQGEKTTETKSRKGFLAKLMSPQEAEPEKPAFDMAAAFPEPEEDAPQTPADDGDDA
jgi:hypothetical protein